MAFSNQCFRNFAIGTLVLCWFSCGMFVIYPVFLLHKPAHRCQLPLLNSSEQQSNFTHQQTNETLEERHNIESCYEPSPHRNESKTCSRGWVYVMPAGHRTVVTEFDLVCDKDWLKPLMSSMLMGGMMLGSLLGGVLSDRFGRKPIFIAGVVGNLLCAVLLALSPVVPAIAFCVFAGGIFNIFRISSSVVLLQEAAPTRHRSLLLLLQMSSFSTGSALLPLISYLFPNWRHLMFALAFVSVCTCAPAVLVVPESAKWIATRNVGRITNLETPSDTKTFVKPKEERSENVNNNAKSNPTFLVLLKQKFLLRRLLVLVLVWSSSAFSFFAISFNTDNLGDNRYVSASLAAMSEVVGDIFLFFITRKMGYRYSYTMLTTLAGGIIFTTPFVKRYSESVGLALAICGKILVSATYSLLYVSTGDLVPTMVRNQVYGIVTFVSRITLLAMPFVLYLGEKVYEPVPYFIMTFVLIVAGIFYLILPETKDQKQPESLNDAKLQERSRLNLRCKHNRKEEKIENANIAKL